MCLHGTFGAEFDSQGRRFTTGWLWNRREDLLRFWWYYWRELLPQMSSRMYCHANCLCVYSSSIWHSYLALVSVDVRTRSVCFQQLCMSSSPCSLCWMCWVLILWMICCADDRQLFQNIILKCWNSTRNKWVLNSLQPAPFAGLSCVLLHLPATVPFALTAAWSWMCSNRAACKTFCQSVLRPQYKDWFSVSSARAMQFAICVAQCSVCHMCWCDCPGCTISVFWSSELAHAMLLVMTPSTLQVIAGKA